ncbi:C40 family peptidase [Collinsella tanakaei]|uniref:GH25 family lysozyme n=1 Tax=Collinsella tanakaei TaxID=626935 RepID=UPI00195CD1BB|nr:GH25 family lysozyme [Collinsella tanakaei]MBM6756926.1 C40 family peptidase [Collinsella tanakaei]
MTRINRRALGALAAVFCAATISLPQMAFAEVTASDEAAAEMQLALAAADGTETTESSTETRTENSWRYEDGVLRDDLEEDDGISLMAMGTLPAGATAQGIDVSAHQGMIDWDKVKAAGVDFAILRVGFQNVGGFEFDAQWHRNVAECERLGIPYGVYIYSYARTNMEADIEANGVIAALQGHHPQLPVYLDMEDSTTLGSDFASVASTFCNKIQLAGYTPGVYASLSWWRSYLYSPVFNNWSRWVAQYYSSCTYEGAYSAWQYTSSGRVDGIVGRSPNWDPSVDMNYWYGTLPTAEPGYTGWVDGAGNPCDPAQAVGWEDNGYRATSKFFYDPTTNAWYWTEADGSIAKNHDAFVPVSNNVAGYSWEHASAEWRAANGKWVRLGADGKLVKGESYHDGKWYLFDDVTGAMQYGFKLLSDGGGAKWVFYDYITGIMAHGECHIDGSRGDVPGWIYCDDVSGAVTYGWKEIPAGNNETKWVYYNTTTGRMVYGDQVIDGYERHFDLLTGAADKAGYQNPAQYFQVSSLDVTLPEAASGTRFDYVTPSAIAVDADRDDCVDAILERARDYVGTPYEENCSLAPKKGIDGAGLVMQCLYAVGMDLGDYNPYLHGTDPAHANDADLMAADERFKHVDEDDIEPGDLVFYPGNVAIYIGDDEVIGVSEASKRVRVLDIEDAGEKIVAVARPLVD